MEWDEPPPSIAPEMREGLEKDLRSTPVDALMTTPIRCVDPSCKLSEVRADLVLGARGALPVVGADGTAVGLISKTDSLRSEREGGATTVDEAMSPFVIAVQVGEPLDHAISRMSHDQVHHVVVLNASRRPVGVVSSLDILHWLTGRLGLSFARRESTKP